MLHGELSNQSYDTIGVMCMDNLVFQKKSGFLARLSTSVLGKYYNAKIDLQVKELLEYIFRKTPYTADLIVLRKDYGVELEEFLKSNDVPYNRILEIKNYGELTSMLNARKISYLQDNNSSRRNRVCSKWALSLSQMFSIIRNKN